MMQLLLYKLLYLILENTGMVKTCYQDCCEEIMIYSTQQYGYWCCNMVYNVTELRLIMTGKLGRKRDEKGVGNRADVLVLFVWGKKPV